MLFLVKSLHSKRMKSGAKNGPGIRARFWSLLVLAQLPKAQKHVTISSFPIANASQIDRNAPKAFYEWAACYCKTPDFAITQAWNCGNSAISTQDAARAGPDLQLRWKMCAVPLRCHQSNIPGTRCEPLDKPCRLFVRSTSKPEVKASDVFLRGLHPQNQTKKPCCVGSESYKPEVKASDVFQCGLHTKNVTKGPYLVGFEVCKPQLKTSDVFLCGLQPKIIPRNPVCGLRGLESCSESIKRVSCAVCTQSDTRENVFFERNC